MDKTAVERNKRCRAKKLASGLVRIELYCPPEHKALIREYARKLYETWEKLPDERGDGRTPLPDL